MGITSAFKVVIADDAAISNAFSMAEWISGIITVPSGWTAANVGFQVCDTESGTYTILREDDADQPIQIVSVSTSAARSYKIPNDVFPANWVKLWSKSTTAATETDVNQTGGPLSITVMLK
jgi:hypothetical protein